MPTALDTTLRPTHNITDLQIKAAAFEVIKFQERKIKELEAQIETTNIAQRKRKKINKVLAVGVNVVYVVALLWPKH